MHESRSSADPPQASAAADSGDVCSSLLSRVAAGDVAAFEDLYRSQGAILLAVAMRVLHNRSLAEEVLQEVFADVWSDSSSYDSGRGSGRAWLTTMCRRRAIDRVRSVQAQQDRDYTEGVHVAHSEVPDASSTALDHVESARAATALRELPEDQARAIALAYYQELSHREVAERLGVPLGTVKTRIRDGMRRLRADLGVADGR